MSAIETDHTVFFMLTANEREILRLLAAGHTVKTIAAQLDRSEASINERLREARRKTNIGSSRELARLLAASAPAEGDGAVQKNCHENIDLAATPALAAQGGDRLPDAGRPHLKGTLMFMLALSATAAVTLLTASPPTTAPSAQTGYATVTASPLAGSWSLDVSGIPQAERPRKVTIAFRPAADGKWAIHVEVVRPDGASAVADSVGAPDGKPIRISGTMDFIDTATLRQPAPDTMVMTLSKDGSPVSTRVYTVSRDRKSMTETIIWANGQMPRPEATRFIRID